MKDFFDQFRENLAGRPEPEFDLRDWQKLEARLDESPAKRHFALPFLWWIALPLGLLLLGANISFWFEIRQAHQAIEKMESRRDTVYVSKVIHYTDTVFVTRVLRQNVVEYSPKDVFLKQSVGVGHRMDSGLTNRSRTNHSHVATETQRGEGTEKKDPASEKTSIRAFAKMPAEAPLIADSLAYKGLPDMVDTISIRQATIHVTPDSMADSGQLSQKDMPEGKPLTKRLPDLRPKGFSLFATGALAMPPIQGEGARLGWSAGLGYELEFSKKLRLWADVNFQQNRLELARMDAAIGVPPIVPPDDDLKFVVATAAQGFTQFSAGMTHVFRPEAPWRPMLGAGWGIRFTSPYDLTYEFENEGLNISWKFESEVPPAEKRRQFALLRGGIEHTFSLHWRMQIGCGLRSDFASGGIRKVRFTGIQLGLGRTF